MRYPSSPLLLSFHSTRTAFRPIRVAFTSVAARSSLSGSAFVPLSLLHPIIPKTHTTPMTRLNFISFSIGMNTKKLPQDQVFCTRNQGFRRKFKGGLSSTHDGLNSPEDNGTSGV